MFQASVMQTTSSGHTKLQYKFQKIVTLEKKTLVFLEPIPELHFQKLKFEQMISSVGLHLFNCSVLFMLYMPSSIT